MRHASFGKAPMNRRDRRRAVALNRRTGYMHRVAAAMPLGAGVHVATIEHDRWCAIYRAGTCDCVPDVSISGPDGVTVVDEHGVARRMRRSDARPPAAVSPSRCSRAPAPVAWPSSRGRSPVPRLGVGMGRRRGFGQFRPTDGSGSPAAAPGRASTGRRSDRVGRTLA
jgi:hypothetical protein